MRHLRATHREETRRSKTAIEQHVLEWPSSAAALTVPFGRIRGLPPDQCPERSDVSAAGVAGAAALALVCRCRRGRAWVKVAGLRATRATSMIT